MTVGTAPSAPDAILTVPGPGPVGQCPGGADSSARSANVPDSAGGAGSAGSASEETEKVRNSVDGVRGEHRRDRQRAAGGM